MAVRCQSQYISVEGCIEGRDFVSFGLEGGVDVCTNVSYKMCFDLESNDF